MHEILSERSRFFGRDAVILQYKKYRQFEGNLEMIVRYGLDGKEIIRWIRESETPTL